jgi:hypothetical protein
MKTPYIIGFILTIISSLLPWQVEGDVIPIWTDGIRIYPSIKDNGGLIIIFLSLFVLWLAFRPPTFIEKPSQWIVGLCSIIVVDTVIHIIKVMISHEAARGSTGAPSIQFGLIMVLVGSIMLLVTSVINYHRAP